MQNYEKLGVFYLGRTEKDFLLYESKHLLTHAVCVGMTGSGKTGLCLGLLEEAAIDGVPALVIDPKGDLGNLLLTFPELRPEDFEPWVNEDDARKKGVSREQFAAEQAALWKEGLAKWEQDGDRIRRLREAADFSIYTPGSSAGLPVSVVRSFAAPPPALRGDREAMVDRIGATATALLGLLGIEADPIQSRDHILLAKIFDAAWSQGQDLDLAALIGQIQQPPISRIGVMELEQFYPADERFKLAMSLNNLLASPGFEAWLEGDALDIQSLLYTAEGKPRVSIFSIAHLSDAERMFFVSLLLNQVVGWMRTQPGTTSLRAVVYMDEIFGYFPPVKNPPSKQPLLTLLKQARAYGVGVVLATQNPVDLDYKGLSNAGTWFIGRLQTERDKARLVEGLEGAAAAAGGASDRNALDQLLASLATRQFLINNVHEGELAVFESRWAMSYLCGPLTRAQIGTLMNPRKSARPAAPAPVPSPLSAPAAESGPRPVLPPGIPQYFLPAAGEGVRYTPALLGIAQVRYTDAKTKIDCTRDLRYVTPIGSEAVPVRWEDAAVADVDASALETAPVEGACFAQLPGPASKAKSYAAWQKDYINWIALNAPLELLRCPSLGMVSEPDESERGFRIRLSQTAREQRDEVAEQLRQRYAPKRAALAEKIRRAQQTVEKESEQARDQMVQTGLAVASGLLGAFLGRKVVSQRTISAASTAARSIGRISRERGDVGRAGETREALEQQLADLDRQFQDDVAAMQARIDPVNEVLEKLAIRARKTNISIQLFTLAWRPG